MSEKTTEEKSQTTAFYLETGARIYVGLTDRNEESCYYMIAHDMQKDFFGSHHQINLYKCSKEDTVGKPFYDNGNDQLWVGGVDRDENGEIANYYNGICLVKSYTSGHLPYGATAKEMRELTSDYAYFIPKEEIDSFKKIDETPKVDEEEQPFDVSEIQE